MRRKRERERWNEEKMKKDEQKTAEGNNPQSAKAERHGGPGLARNESANQRGCSAWRSGMEYLLVLEW